MRLGEPHKLYVTWHSPRHCCHCATTVISGTWLTYLQYTFCRGGGGGGMVGKKHFASSSHERQQHAKVMK